MRPTSFKGRAGLIRVGLSFLLGGALSVCGGGGDSPCPGGSGRDDRCPGAGTHCNYKAPNRNVCYPDGSFGLGEPCFYQQNCTDGLRCSDGACAELGVAGEACDGDESCVQGLYCNTAYRCSARGGAGDPCDPFGGDAECGDGLICRAGSCELPGAVGESCFEDQDCAGRLVCFDCACRAAGEEGTPCAVNECTAGLACNLGYLYFKGDGFGRCVVPSNGEIGQPCEDTLGTTWCTAGLACNFGTHTCEMPGSAAHGAPCADKAWSGTEFCAPGLECDGNYMPQICLRAEEMGTPLPMDYPPRPSATRPACLPIDLPEPSCANISDCTDGLVCIADQCRPAATLGEDCRGPDCESQLVCDRTTHTCVPPPM